MAEPNIKVCARYDLHFMSRAEFAAMSDEEARDLHLRFRVRHGKDQESHLHDLSGILCGVDCMEALVNNTPFIAVWAIQDKPGVYEDAPICSSCMKVFVSNKVQS